MFILFSSIDGELFNGTDALPEALGFNYRQGLLISLNEELALHCFVLLNTTIGLVVNVY